MRINKNKNNLDDLLRNRKDFHNKNLKLIMAQLINIIKIIKNKK